MLLRLQTSDGVTCDSVWITVRYHLPISPLFHSSLDTQTRIYMSQPLDSHLWLHLLFSCGHVQITDAGSRAVEAGPSIPYHLTFASLMPGADGTHICSWVCGWIEFTQIWLLTCNSSCGITVAQCNHIDGACYPIHISCLLCKGTLPQLGQDQCLLTASLHFYHLCHTHNCSWSSWVEFDVK